MKKVLLLVLIAGIIIISYYFIFSKEGLEKGNPISGVFTSEDQKYVEALNDKDIQKLVFSSLPEYALKPGFGGKVFCSSHIFGFDGNYKENIVNVFVFAFCEEYYLKADKITLGSSISYPLKLIYKIDKQDLVYDSLISPKEGNEYASSIRIMFPEKYANGAIEGIDVTKFIPSPKTQADNYYTGKLEVYF